MMSIRSLADFNGSSLGGDSDWLTPPPSPPRPQTPGRHGERGIGTSNWPPAETFTWPHTGTFSWPRTAAIWSAWFEKAQNQESWFLAQLLVVLGIAFAHGFGWDRLDEFFDEESSIGGSRTQS